MKIMTSGRALSLAAAGISAMAVVFFFPPAQYSFYPRCPIYEATHLLCPGCGGTRALYELLHLNFARALHYNAFITVLTPLAALWSAASWYQAARKGSVVELSMPLGFGIGLAILAVLFTVVRNTGIAFSI
jgi:Protein of unknown function (DUF2752)